MDRHQRDVRDQKFREHRHKEMLGQRLKMEKDKLADHTSGHHQLSADELRSLRRKIENLERHLQRGAEFEGAGDRERRERERAELYERARRDREEM